MIKKIINRAKEFNSTQEVEPRSNRLYSVTALFDTPDEIINASSAVANAGYSKFDVYTPYPVHGIERAMKLKDTKIGYVALVFGILGTITAQLMIWWMTGFDYRNIIGGKPFVGMPATIPITFELTVLFASIATVLGLLFLFSRLPYLANPLQDTDFMARVTSDKFGVVIRANDPKFNEFEVSGLFTKLNGKNISPVYYFVDNLQTKTPIFNGRFIMFLAILSVVTGLTSYLVLNKLLYDVEPFNWMWTQFRIKPQTPSTFFADGYNMRKPVEGTVARGFIPYEYQGMPDSVARLLANPIPITKESLDRGKNRYDIYCSPCHGYFGSGDSRLRGQFPNPPSLHTDRARNMADGNLYNIITNGQNTMPSYQEQVSREDRWAIINYIRALQRSQNAKDEDMQSK